MEFWVSAVIMVVCIAVILVAEILLKKTGKDGSEIVAKTADAVGDAAETAEKVLEAADELGGSPGGLVGKAADAAGVVADIAHTVENAVQGTGGPEQPEPEPPQASDR